MKKYVYYNNNYYYTNDDWNSFEKTKRNPGNDYLNENNRDIIVKFKLIDHFGYEQGVELVKTFENIRKDINDMYKKNNKGPIYCDGYGHSFEVLAIATLFKKTFKEVINENLIIGSDDGKVDAIIKESDVFKCFQIKLFEKVSSQDSSIMRDNINEYVRTKNITSNNSKDLLEYCQSKLVGKFNIEFLTISNDREGTVNKNSINIIREFFKIRLCPMLDNHLTLDLKYKFNNIELKYIDFKNTFFMYYPILELCKVIKSGNFTDYQYDSLFSGNVRRFKNNNNEILETINDEKEKKNFYLYNNGISLCGDIERYDSGDFIIRNPMIINGQQTFKTIYKLFLDKPEVLNDVFVPLFLKKMPADDMNMRYKVAKYNNKQMSVKENDFLSIDENVRYLQLKIYDYSLDKHKKDEDNPIIFLDIISNGGDSTIELSKFLFMKEAIIKVPELLRLILTVEHPENVHEYKNKKNFDYEQISKLAFQSISVEKAYKLCIAIYKYNWKLKSFKKPKRQLVEYTAANLIIQYLIYKGISVDESFNMATTVKNSYKSDIVKLYKTSSIHEYYNLKELKLK